MNDRLLLLFTLITAACLAAAPGTVVDGPSLGYIHDTFARQVLRLSGIPGAAQAGAALDICAALESAAVSPEQDYVLVVCGTEREIHIVGLTGDRAFRRIDVGAAPEQVALSPLGTAAALWNREGTLLVLTGLPERPEARTVALGELDASLRKIAISDDGTLVMVAAADSELLIVDDAGVRPAGISGVADVRFRPGTHDAAMLSASGLTLLSRDGLQVISPPLEDARALEFFRDGSRIFVATAVEVVALSLTGERIASAPAPCAPTGLNRLNRDSVLRITCKDDPTVRIVETRGNMRVLFVPPFSE